MSGEIKTLIQAENLPFYLDMTGTTHCNGSYHILRNNSSINVLEYIISGYGTISQNKTTVHPQQGDVFILTQGNRQEYQADRDTPWTKIWISVKGSLPKFLLNAYNLSDIILIKDCNISPFIYEIQQICTTPTLTPYEIQSKCSEIFFKLIQFIALKNSVEDHSDAAALKIYIDTNLEKNLTLQDLADQTSHSITHTIRLFKSKYGITPYEYILSQRIEQAKLLLSNTALKVKEISARVGFSDEHYFSLYFRRRIGISPLEYRERNL